MKLEKLQFVVEDRVGIITMNYMKNLNAIDDQRIHIHFSTLLDQVIEVSNVSSC